MNNQYSEVFIRRALELNQDDVVQELSEALIVCRGAARDIAEDVYKRQGSGKTYLACALGKEACLNHVRVRYVRLPDLLMEYGDSTVVAGNQRKLLERYSRIPLLILDEWLVSDISDAELHFLFELMERRSDTTSTIFCTQYRKDDWVKRLGEGVRAEAIVDRYAYTAFWIETGSTNMREYCAKHKM